MASIDLTAWQTLMNTSSSVLLNKHLNSSVFLNLNRPIDNIKLEQWLRNLTWTPESVAQWQEFYNKAPRLIIYDRGNQTDSEVLPIIPKYEDIKVEPCNKKEIQNSTDRSCGDSNNSMASQHTLFVFALILFVFRTIFG
jgi:uncharacterized Zn-finger protein